MKDLLAIVAASGDVMRYTWDNDSRRQPKLS
jgi:YD repeat-containing protein